MDSVPVYYEVGRGRANPKEKSAEITKFFLSGNELDPMCEIEYSLKYDKKKCFLDELDRLERLTHDVPCDALHWMFHYDSGKCFAAVLKGETAGMFEFHERLPVLHKAADFEAAEITKLFLSGNESQANLRLDYYYGSKQNWKEVLPLHLILEKIRTSTSLPLLMPFDEKGSRSRCHSYLSIDMMDTFQFEPEPEQDKMDTFQLEPEQFVFKLLFHMMTDLHMRKPLEIVRLLARQTKEIEQEFLMYLKEGKVVELITLLLVARETVMPSFERKLEIRKFVVKEIASLNVFVLRSAYVIWNDKMVQEGQEKKAKMEAILLILEIFDRIGDKLAAYLRIKQKNVSIVVRANDFAWFAEEAGFDVKLDRFFQFGLCFGNSTLKLGGYDYDSEETNNYEMDGHNNNETPRDSESNKSYDEAYINAISDDEGLDKRTDIVGSEVNNKPLEDLILNDDKDGFVSFIRSHLKEEICGTSENIQHYGDIIRWICSHRAKNCATALLEGETGLSVDLNVLLKSGFYPLHHAAENLSSSLTDLFLCHEARTDLPCSINGSKYHGMLPLSVALEAIRCHQYLSDWHPRKSIFKLIFILCMPELIGPLETIKLLSERTEELQVICSSIAREGRLVELAALLSVAWKKLLVSVTDEGVDSSVIGQCIMGELTSLIDQEYKLMGTGQCKELIQCRKMKAAMVSASLMLKVFDRAGDDIDTFRQSFEVNPRSKSQQCHAPNFRRVQDSIHLFKKLGFALKRRDIHVDDITCFIDRIDPEQSEELDRSIKRILQSKSSLSGKAQSALSSVKRTRKKRALNDLPSTSQVYSIPSRLFHTCQLPMSRSVPKLYKPVGAPQVINTSKHHTCQLPKLYKPVGASQMINTSKPLGEYSKVFSPMRWTFCYLQAIKRRIR